MAVMRSYAYLMRAYDGPEIAGIPAHMCGPAGQYDNAPTASSPRFTHQNSPGEQAYRAEILKNRSGLGQWPVCGRLYRTG